MCLSRHQRRGSSQQRSDCHQKVQVRCDQTLMAQVYAETRKAALRDVGQGKS